MTHHETIIAHRLRQLTALAQIRGTLPKFDQQAVAELYNKEPATLNDKDFELIQAITMRNLTMVPA